MSIETMKKPEVTNAKEQKEQKTIAETQENLEKLSIETLQTKLKEIAPIYFKDFEKINNKEKLINWYYKIIFLQNILWENFAKLVFKWKTVEWFKLNNSIPLDKINEIYNELQELQKEYWIEFMDTLILTVDELKDLIKNIESWKFKEILRQQFEENISLTEALSDTKLAKAFEKQNIPPEKLAQIIRNYENFTFWLLQKEYPDISPDTLKNTATSILLTIIKLVNQWKIQNFDLRKKYNIITKLNLKQFFDKIFTDEQVKANSEKYQILIDPNKFSDLIIDYLTWTQEENKIIETIKSSFNEKIKIDKQNILNKIKLQLNEKWVESLKPEHIKVINQTNNIIWQLNKGLKNAKKNIKDTILENSSALFSLKEMFEGLWIWWFVEKIVDWILKLIWFKNWWKDLEKAAEKQKDKTVYKHLKNYFENTVLKNDKNLFYKLIKQKTTQPITHIIPKWNLSPESINLLWWNWKNINWNIADLFENQLTIEKLKKLVDEKTLKNLITIKQPKNSNQNIAIVDLSKLDIILKKYATQQQINYLSENINIENLKEDQKKFIQRIYPTAKKVANELWIPVTVILAQAALESWWWKSGLAREANNLFGIKAGRSWKWEIYEKNTKEHINWKTITIKGKFRKYCCWEESIKDYWRLLQSERYQKKLNKVKNKNSRYVITAIKDAWYATDPGYVTKVFNIEKQISGIA